MGLDGDVAVHRLHLPLQRRHVQAFVKLLREDLDHALATLPDCYRVVVVMSDLEEFSYAEIAEALDIPVGTARPRLARARGDGTSLAHLQELFLAHGLRAAPQGSVTSASSFSRRWRTCTRTWPPTPRRPSTSRPAGWRVCSSAIRARSST
ncbi:MAG: sigma factor-like helix-turn-helix DNA-binding protein [Pseudomonadota bacterium]